MSFSTAIKTCFAKYFVFSGRASRSEYWWFTLFMFLASFVLGFIEGFVNTATGERGSGPTLLTGAFSLATLIPSLSVGWRRMHDTGRSGLYLLYPIIVMTGIGLYISLFVGFDPAAPGNFSADGINGLILMIAAIVLIISPLLVLWWLTRPSEPGRNEFGPNPYEGVE